MDIYNFKQLTQMEVSWDIQVLDMNMIAHLQTNTTLSHYKYINV